MKRHLQIAHDDRKQVVEVVGDAARELAHRLHLLSLMQACMGLFHFPGAFLDPALQVPMRFFKGLLRALELADIADDTDQNPPAVLIRKDRLLRDDDVRLSVSVRERLLVDVHLTALKYLRILLPERLGFRARKEVEVRLAEDFVSPMTHEIAERLIDNNPAMLVVLHKQRIGDGVQDAVQQASGLLELQGLRILLHWGEAYQRYRKRVRYPVGLPSPTPIL